MYTIYNIGFLTYDGTVTASKARNMPGREVKINPAISNSWEYKFHLICKKKKLEGSYLRK